MQKEIVKLAAAKIIKNEMDKRAGLLTLLSIPFMIKMFQDAQPDEDNQQQVGGGVSWDGSQESALEKAWSGIKNAFGGDTKGINLPTATAMGLTGGSRISSPSSVAPGTFYGNELANVLGAVNAARGHSPLLNSADTGGSGGLFSGLSSTLGNLFGG